jgi:putative pyoverdin transport system ATP-binding/permease protein
MEIKRASTSKYILFAFLSLVTALANMGIVYMINRIMNSYFDSKAIEYNNSLIWFFIGIIFFFAGRWLVSRGLIRFTQDLLVRTKKEVMGMVLRSQYLALAKYRGRVYTALTRDADNIVSASINLVDIITSGMVILICFIYMGILSWKLLCCMIALTLFTLWIYFSSEVRARTYFKKAIIHNDNFIRYLNEVLGGFKEIVIERRKGKEIEERHLSVAIKEGSMLNQTAQVIYLNNRIIGQIAFYAFIAILLAFLASLFQIPKVTVINFVFLTLYIWGPIETVVLLVPNLSQAKLSLNRIRELEEQMKGEDAHEIQNGLVSEFSRLELKEISYVYEGAAGNESMFGIGPIDFSLTAGEVIFISGGNGSGKTTFVNILMGLYPGQRGSIYVNDKIVDSDKLSDYRSLFAPVFSDYFLFDECYGNNKFDAQKASEYLRMLELEEKVFFSGKRPSTIELSTGQRKRLALCYAMLERKPILILDEFAAEQDPSFKRKFYTEILKFIKGEGFSVIAITHDDKYYSCADKVFRMEAGKMNDLFFYHELDLESDEYKI